jgi:hypothetical protein
MKIKKYRENKEQIKPKLHTGKCRQNGRIKSMQQVVICTRETG